MDVIFDFGRLHSVGHVEPEYSILNHAMDDAGAAVANFMRAALSGMALPGMTRTVNRPDLADFVHVTTGNLEFSIQSPDEIEQPTAPYDMKPGLLRGPRHRVSKLGQPYTIVPFTHKTSDMPEVVAQMATQLTLSGVTGLKLEVRPDDQWEIMRNTYTWGSNLGKQDNKRFSNMYRFGEDEFVTFRAVSTKSPANSWIHPGRPGNPISESVWNALEPSVTQRITEAWGKALMAAWQ